jgi:benzylsuccinate CoA-transferase BbsF subunit
VHVTTTTAQPGPLHGLRVVDLCWVYAGPVMTRMLADLGAEVIKIESRKRPDGTRLGRRPLTPTGQLPDGVDVDVECQPLNHALNRNKRSLSVDLSTPEGRALVLDLVRVSDVVTDNFAAGAMTRMGLGYPVLRSVQPDIIALSLSGSGQYGRLRDVLAYAGTLAPLGGVGLLVGEADRVHGVMSPTYGDSNAAIRAAGALLIALYHRKRTGEGQHIDVSEWETTMTGLEEAFLSWQLTGVAPAPDGNTSREYAPHDNYRCAGDDEWVAIAVRGQDQWTALCDAAGLPDLVTDPRFGDHAARVANAAALNAMVTEWTRTRGADEVAAGLQKAGIAAFKVCSVGDQYGEEHFYQREVFVESDHPVVGVEIVPGRPFRYTPKSGGPLAPISRPAPTVGEANHYVVRELLGESEDTFERLTRSGVLH